MNTIRAQQFDTVDAIAWRHYRQSSGTVEAILQANPGLADLGAILPHGYPVTLPDLPAPSHPKPLLQLWD